MAASDLTTTTVIGDELGIAANTVPTRLIQAASDAIRSYLNRSALHYSASITEKVAGYGTNRILLSHAPVLAIASITIDGYAIDSTEYEIEDAEAGIIYRRSGWFYTGVLRSGIVQDDRVPGSEQKKIVVVHSGGWVTPAQVELDGSLTRSLPYDLEQACVETVVNMYRKRGNDPMISSETVGSASVSYRDPVGWGLIPDTAIPLLQKYRRIR